MSLLNNNKKKLSTGAVLIALISVGLLAAGVYAYTSLTGSTSGNITSTTTSSSSSLALANLKITGASTNATEATCSYSDLNAQCSGWSLGQGGIATMSISVMNTGAVSASPVPGTSGVTPSDASCSFTTAPPTITAGGTQNYILTYKAGQMTGTATCDFTIA
jgi:hypothetical protein